MKQLRNGAVPSTRWGDEAGQALVETAFVFIFVLLLLGGLIEFGWAYFHYIALQNAAGEGAAYGMMYSTWHQGNDSSLPNYQANPNNIEFRVRSESETDIIDWSAPTTRVFVEAPFVTPGNPITVTISFEHQLITPLLTTFMEEDTIEMRATAVQTILSPPPSP